MKDPSGLVRENIYKLKPYSSARKEFKGEASVFLDANENPLNTPYNRYPDPLQEGLKRKIAKIKNVRSSQIMLGVGSDEPIDLAIRIFCQPGKDNIVAIDPTYGMYEVCADINDVEYRKVLLDEDYGFNAGRLLQAVDDKTKIVFLCSPNNPTGNIMNINEVRKVFNSFEGIVVIDEAYVDFSSHPSWLAKLDEHQNMIVLQTFSKAWALASVRCGMAFASEKIIDYFNKVKYPYNLNMLTQQLISRQIEHTDIVREWVSILLQQRSFLAEQLSKIPFVEKTYPSEANFILTKVTDADSTYKKLAEKGVIVRNRSNISLCNNCLRITVGTKEENEILIELLKQL